VIQKVVRPEREKIVHAIEAPRVKDIYTEPVLGTNYLLIILSKE
jgi:hypothetical protein